MKLLSCTAVLCNFNHSAFLPAALESLAAQSRPLDEIILIDDGSTDSSAEILSSWAAGKSNVRLVLHPSNQGFLTCLNQGLNLTTSDLVFFPAADDFYFSNFVEAAVSALACHLRAAFFAADHWEWYGQRVLRRRTAIPALRPGWISPSTVRRLIRTAPSYSPAPMAIVWRLNKFLQIGPYDQKLRWHCDWHHQILGSLRFGFAYSNEPLAVMRMRDDSFSSSGTRNRRAQMEVIQRIFEKAEGESGIIRKQFSFPSLHSYSPNSRAEAFRFLITHPRWWSYLQPRWLLLLIQGRIRRRLWDGCRLLLACLPSPITKRVLLPILRVFGARIARNVRLDGFIDVENPWLFRVGSGCQMESPCTFTGKERIVLRPYSHVPAHSHIASTVTFPGLPKDFPDQFKPFLTPPPSQTLIISKKIISFSRPN